MQRRTFLTGAAAAGAAAASTAVNAPAIGRDRREVKMVTSWPKNFPGLGTGAERLARRITDMSDGRLDVQVYAAGELVPAMETLDAVISGTADMAHSASYYWQGKSKALNFFTGVPFGMTPAEITAWLRQMGGQELWDRVYDQFGVKGFPAGQTGVQAGGWFGQEINTLDDVKGLKFRTPGLGGEVWRRLGAAVTNMPGGEIFTALQSGRLDAAEFVGPLTDLALGFHEVAPYYYWPSFNEPGMATELAVNKRWYTELPKDLQHIIEVACEADYDAVYAEFTGRNANALRALKAEHGVEVRSFPEELMIEGGKAAAGVIEELRSEGDKLTRETVESFLEARQKLKAWSSIADLDYLRARQLPFDYAEPK